MAALLFTSTLLIISLAFIAIAEGTGDRNASASSPGCMQVATLIHIGEIRPAKANKPVTLQVAGQEPCTVKINNGETKCKITGDELNGNLIFKTEKGTEISASFEQAKLFSENKCVIELDTYNKETHETKLKINGNNFMIKKKEGSVSIKCGGRANTV
uniref:Uncharacterized protein n=1 Tax=Meloidogyne javanica TaxID=6303 RepID=A0A915N8A3_MELJA